jgi:hypothetical protein
MAAFSLAPEEITHGRGHRAAGRGYLIVRSRASPAGCSPGMTALNKAGQAGQRMNFVKVTRGGWLRDKPRQDIGRKSWSRLGCGPLRARRFTPGEFFVTCVEERLTISRFTAKRQDSAQWPAADGSSFSYGC